MVGNPGNEAVSQAHLSCERTYQASFLSLCPHTTGAPPIPPPPPIGGYRGIPGVPMKKAVIPNVPLPMLNWIPIRNPEHTIFKVTWNPAQKPPVSWSWQDNSNTLKSLV